MKTNEARAVVWLVLVCLLGHLWSCTVSRDVRRSEQLRSTDSTTVSTRSAESRSAISAHHHATDTTKSTAAAFGSVDIRRDSAGRVVYLLWNYTGSDLRTRAGRELDGVLTIDTRNTADTLRRTAAAADVRADTATAAAAGMPVEKTVGILLLAFVLIYVTIVITWNLWKNEK